MTVQIRRGEKIFCIGDSHSSFFSGAETIQPLWPKASSDHLPFFRSFRIGTALAYSLASWDAHQKGREILRVMLNRDVPDSEKQVPSGAAVMLCFGEIDCRCHVVPQANRPGNSLESVVESIGQRYCSAVQDVQSWGYRPLVWNVIPSSPWSRGGNSTYPINGTCEERNRATCLLNQHLRDWCQSNGATFVDIYDQLINDDGTTRGELLMDGFHLSQRAMPFVLDWLRKHAPALIPRRFTLAPPPGQRSAGFRVSIRKVGRGLLSRLNSTRTVANKSISDVSKSD